MGPTTTATGNTAVAPAAASYTMASLYVGDLHPDVSESMLFDKFSQAGSVLSIRVCRDAITRRSLGYAYVNFQQPADAERALETMNFDVMMGRPMRIMWSQRDPSARRAGQSNIFIKNLGKEVDNKSIYDTFSQFGHILSCKVATDEEGNSKGYCFLHFDSEESANSAIDKVNGMLLAGRKVFVGKFIPKALRLKELGASARRFNNVYVKGFDEKTDKTKLEELFSKFGKITSCAVMVDGDGKPKGFGFVAFENAEEAENAVKELHDSTIGESDGKKLFVCRAQKKGERSAELKRKFDIIKNERQQRFQGVNLYVKNLEDTVDDEALRRHFEPFGKITSAKVMLDEHNRSKGFGFVCFEKPDEATKAVTELNSQMMGNKPLYVALAQRKEDRRAQLASQYMQRLAQMRMQATSTAGGVGPAAGIYGAGQPGYYVQGLPRTAAAPASAGFMGGMPAVRQSAVAAAARGPINAQNWLAAPNAGGYPTMQATPAYQYQQSRPGRPAYTSNLQSRAGGLGAQQGVRGPQMNAARLNMPHSMTGGGGGVKPNGPYGPGYSAVAARLGAGGQPHQQQVPAPGQEQQNNLIMPGQLLSANMLSQAGPEEQKQLLGERIFAAVSEIYRGNADVGKITGMMLGMDNAELLLLLQDHNQLRAKAGEALQVLKDSQSASASGGQA